MMEEKIVLVNDLWFDGVRADLKLTEFLFSI